MQPFPTSPYDRPRSTGGSTSQGTGKQFQTKAERRAGHNATERARRENLNVKLQELAFTLPNLQNDTRPSKTTIIDRTLDFVKNAILMEERYQNRITELEKFNKYLLSEADERLKRKKQKKNPKTYVKSASTSPVIAPALISSPAPSMMKPNQNASVASEEEYDEVDNEYCSRDLRGSTEKSMSAPMKQINQQFVSVAGAHNHLVPVSQSSVSMMPTTKSEYCTTNITNWPMTSPTPTHYIKQEQHMPYYLHTQTSVQKSQDHRIAHTITEQEDGLSNHSLIYNNYPMLNHDNTNSFMASTLMMEPEHHHLIHRC